jgi:hypothetical protein
MQDVFCFWLTDLELEEQARKGFYQLFEKRYYNYRLQRKERTTGVKLKLWLLPFSH